MRFLHKRIKMFQLEGQILDDRTIADMKEKYIKLLSESMKDQGYVIRLDIDPDWTIQYTGNHYEFILSVYGSHIGKRNAACIDGLDKNRPIYTRPNKSEESYLDRESTLNQK